MTTNDSEYWPFPISETDKQWPELLEKITFLKEVCAAGFTGYRFGMNNYGARYDDRSGIIIERGQKRWELRLSQAETRKLSAFVSGFSTAGQALNSWLKGSSVSDILAELSDSLVVPPGASASHVISESTD